MSRIHGHAIHPASELRPTLEARQVAPRREKHVLAGFPVRRSRCGEAHGQAVELVFVAARVPRRRRVLVAGAPHQYSSVRPARADGFRLSGCDRCHAGASGPLAGSAKNRLVWPESIDFDHSRYTSLPLPHGPRRPQILRFHQWVQEPLRAGAVGVRPPGRRPALPCFRRFGRGLLCLLSSACTCSTISSTWTRTAPIP